MSPDRSPELPVVNHKKNQSHKSHWAWAVATFFGTGHLKPGPGTWGSVAALMLWAAFARFAHPSPHALLFALLASIVTATAFGVPAATVVERQSGRTDPGFVVIDEVVGQWITLLFCPFNWPHALIALILFRLFDITKPFPVRRLERLPAGWGIVFDDIAAGLYALVVATLIRIWY